MTYNLIFLKVHSFLSCHMIKGVYVTEIFEMLHIIPNSSFYSAVLSCQAFEQKRG